MFNSKILYHFNFKSSVLLLGLGWGGEAAESGETEKMQMRTEWERGNTQREAAEDTELPASGARQLWTLATCSGNGVHPQDSIPLCSKHLLGVYFVCS